MPTDELTCQELVELVTDYLEDAMPFAERQRFEEHLEGCQVCPRYVEQLRATIRVVGRLREDDVTEIARVVLLDAFRAWKSA